jgi:hypothetical protein
VTRIGEFSPIWQMFSWGQHLRKIAEIFKILSYFLTRKKLGNDFDKNEFVYILGTNTSGHPA